MIIPVYVFAIPNETEYGPGYGDEWLLYQDESGTHIMNFTAIPNDTRGLIFGDAYYYLYTRLNAEPEELHIPNDSDQIFTSQYFNSSNLVKVITHGWLTNMNATWLQDMKNEFLSNNDYNVIIIDWNELSRNPIYPWAAFSTRYVGKQTAKLLDSIAKSYDIDGMDPARPLFELPMMPEHCRLDKTDAEFVDIIHTNSGVHGYYKSQGHADFYPNGGSSPQPGCNQIIAPFDSCSHLRATLYFNESINSATLFKAFPCESWHKFENGHCTVNYTYMGLQAKKEDVGVFYLYTNSEPPFAISS
ncbi:unnamed protein product [Arctia plantaginis]|uniref:Lipase domain-containing protein n=1 Tax=Arctia plantaginis TaxID=874455 RepID=A0A8S0YX66_ARCPL|nr:unnamed protein product [Arctia plantaginis]